MKHLLLWVILISMPLRSSLAAQSTRQPEMAGVAESPQTRAALDWFEVNLNSINDLQTKLAEIPAPSFHEEARASAVEPLLAAAGLKRLGWVDRIAELRPAGHGDMEILLTTGKRLRLSRRYRDRLDTLVL